MGLFAEAQPCKASTHTTLNNTLEACREVIKKFRAAVKAFMTGLLHIKVSG